MSEPEQGSEGKLEQFSAYLDVPRQPKWRELKKDYPWIGKADMGRAMYDLYFELIEEHGFDPKSLRPRGFAPSNKPAPKRRSQEASI